MSGPAHSIDTRLHALRSEPNRYEAIECKGFKIYHDNASRSGRYFQVDGASNFVHVSGTEKKTGRYIPPHNWHDGRRSSVTSPALEVTSPEEMIELLELKEARTRDGKAVFTRDGFSGTYHLQTESDGTVSVFYTGGRHDSGMPMRPQTFHHGLWDLRRSVLLEQHEPSPPPRKPPGRPSTEPDRQPSRDDPFAELTLPPLDTLKTDPVTPSRTAPDNSTPDASKPPIAKRNEVAEGNLTSTDERAVRDPVSDTLPERETPRPERTPERQPAQRGPAPITIEAPELEKLDPRDGRQYNVQNAQRSSERFAPDAQPIEQGAALSHKLLPVLHYARLRVRDTADQLAAGHEVANPFTGTQPNWPLLCDQELFGAIKRHGSEADKRAIQSLAELEQRYLDELQGVARKENIQSDELRTTSAEIYKRAAAELDTLFDQQFEQLGFTGDLASAEPAIKTLWSIYNRTSEGIAYVRDFDKSIRGELKLGEHGEGFDFGPDLRGEHLLLRMVSFEQYLGSPREWPNLDTFDKASTIGKSTLLTQGAFQAERRKSESLELEDKNHDAILDQWEKHMGDINPMPLMIAGRPLEAGETRPPNQADDPAELVKNAAYLQRRVFDAVEALKPELLGAAVSAEEAAEVLGNLRARHPRSHSQIDRLAEIWQLDKTEAPKDPPAIANPRPSRESEAPGPTA